MAVSTSTNRIITTGYGYDANGNMTNDGLNTLMYDAENHAVTSSGGLGSGTYTYDGNGLRVEKVSGSTTTVYIFSGTKVIAEYVNGAAPGSPTREYVYSGGALLAKIEAGATQYYHPDHLSARMMTDSSGNKIGEQGHYPFGESWYLTNTTTKWEFTSYERDAESGNDYAKHRYHVNRLGRFSSVDPKQGCPKNPQNLNRYSYVRNDPVNGKDPRGLDPAWECGFTNDCGDGGYGGDGGIGDGCDPVFGCGGGCDAFEGPDCGGGCNPLITCCDPIFTTCGYFLGGSGGGVPPTCTGTGTTSSKITGPNLCNPGDTAVEEWQCPTGCSLDECKHLASDYTLTCHKKGKNYYALCAPFFGFSGVAYYCHCCLEDKKRNSLMPPIKLNFRPSVIR